MIGAAVGSVFRWVFQAIITTAVVNWLTDYLRRRFK